MIPAKEAKRLVDGVVRDPSRLSRHDKLVIGISYRMERLRRIEPGGMYNLNGESVSAERIEWSRRRLQKTRDRERSLWAVIQLEAQ